MRTSVVVVRTDEVVMGMSMHEQALDMDATKVAPMSRVVLVLAAGSCRFANRFAAGVMVAVTVVVPGR